MVTITRSTIVVVGVYQYLLFAQHLTDILLCSVGTWDSLGRQSLII